MKIIFFIFSSLFLQIYAFKALGDDQYFFPPEILKEPDLGQIKYPDGSLKQITLEDAMWTARMLYGEGGPKVSPEHGKALLWTTIQRSWILKSFRNRSFSDLLKAFSQPINPIWKRDGSRCQPGGKSELAQECAPHLLDRREMVSSLSYDQLSETIKDLTLAFAKGQLKNEFPGVTNFAAQRINRSSQKEPEAFVLEGTRFYKHETTTHWNGTEVTLIPKGIEHQRPDLNLHAKKVREFELYSLGN